VQFQEVCILLGGYVGEKRRSSENIEQKNEKIRKYKFHKPVSKKKGFSIAIFLVSLGIRPLNWTFHRNNFDRFIQDERCMHYNWTILIGCRRPWIQEWNKDDLTVQLLAIVLGTRWSFIYLFS
jgi:hypothetical protein